MTYKCTWSKKTVKKLIMLLAVLVLALLIYYFQLQGCVTVTKIAELTDYLEILLIVVGILAVFGFAQGAINNCSQKTYKIISCTVLLLLAFIVGIFFGICLIALIFVFSVLNILMIAVLGVLGYIFGCSLSNDCFSDRKNQVCNYKWCNALMFWRKK